MNAREEFWNQGCYKISYQWKHFKYCTYTKELVLHTISVVQSHYLCTVLLWMNGLRKMFENHWFRDALMWICNDLCIFLRFFSTVLLQAADFKGPLLSLLDEAVSFELHKYHLLLRALLFHECLLLIVQHWTKIVAVVTSNKVFEMAKGFCSLD